FTESLVKFRLIKSVRITHSCFTVHMMLLPQKALTSPKFPGKVALVATWCGVQGKGVEIREPELRMHTS
ncbi:MAG: hypothetical protein LC729_04320, partial [Acidobacteria bacterium]|nr:hypothetical protein [Acidobacteriota bacterium]